jgi:CBS domain-containing protein
LLLISDDGKLEGMITVKDIMKRLNYPEAVQDDKNAYL